MLDKLRSQHNQSTLDAWLWPPYGEIGIWSDHTRTFSSVYDRRARQHGIKIPPEVVKRHGITDEASLERVIHDGSIVLLGPTTIDVTPSGHLNRLATPMLDSPNDIPQINVLYRGTARRHGQPLIPSFYREFQTPDEARKSDRIRRFTINLVLETVADEFERLLTHNEAESIVQHYKILPWSSMIDLTPDVNVAKAFAASNRPDTHPNLYQVVVWNPGFFDTGSQLIDELPFVRPRVQSAVAHFGFGQDSSTGIVFDRYALIVAITEYQAEKNGSGWERFGGCSFSIGGVEFSNPFLSDDDYKRLNAHLYPLESDPRALRVLDRIVHALDWNLGTFSELGKRIEAVQEALANIRSPL